MAANLQRITTFDDDAILDGAIAQLLTFGNIAGEQFERATVMSLDLATQLGGDVQSSAIMLGKALNDPVRGLGALRRVGIQFTGEQEAVIAALVATGETAKAQGLILDELNAQGYGGQAAAAALAGLGPLQQLRNAFGDLKEVVGEAQSEALVPIVGLVRSLVDGFLALPEPLQKTVAIFGTLAVAIVPIAASLGILALGLGALGAPVLAVAAGVGLVTAALIAFWPEISALPARAKAAFDAAVGHVANFVGAVREWFMGKLGEILDWVKGRVAAVGDAFFELWDRVVGHSYVPDMVDGIEAEFGRLDKVMVEPALAQTETVSGAFAGLGEGVGSSIRDMISSGEFSFGGFVGRMLNHANRMADGIVDDAFGRVAEAAKGLGGGGGGIGGFFGSILKGLGGAFGGGGSVPALDTGGSIEVGGQGGIDRNLAVMRVTKGETINVERRGAARTPGVVVNISTPNPAAFEASRGQVAASISRAVARGSRNL